MFVLIRKRSQRDRVVWVPELKSEDPDFKLWLPAACVILFMCCNVQSQMVSFLAVGILNFLTSDILLWPKMNDPTFRHSSFLMSSSEMIWSCYTTLFYGLSLFIVINEVQIQLIPKWRPINYSFVCMLISPLCLIFTSKFFRVFYTCWRGKEG